jgi:hypothetical protein
MGSTVVIFGAGATKACNGPLTNEILPDAFAVRHAFTRQDNLDLLAEFLVANFGLPPAAPWTKEHFPPLPLLLSLLDTAIDRDDAFGKNWPPERLRHVRGTVEYAIFALLEYRLRNIGAHYRTFLSALYRVHSPATVTILSLNYDLIADNTISALAEQRGTPGFPDYGTDVATDAYRNLEKVGKLLKLHGSLNWLHCPYDHRLDIGIAPSGRASKMLAELYRRGEVNHLDVSYEGDGATPCPDCGTPLRPVLITPTHLKDYRNPHIARIWYEAGRELQQAQRAIFVGYGMPDDDVDVVYLFKRGLAHLDPRAITVVERASGPNSTLDRHPVGLRYRALFGDQIEWRREGFAAWTAAASRRDFEPGPRRRPTPTRRPTAARSP